MNRTNVWTPFVDNSVPAGDLIYIIDDDDAVRSSLEFFFTSVGFSPRTFAVSADFLAEASALRPGCVLLDIRMPGSDGFHVLERLEDRRAVLPIVMMTGHGDVANAVRAMKLGACDFVEKPFNEDVLLEIVRRIFATLADNVRSVGQRANVRARLAGLTPREREVLTGLIAGRPNKTIAYDLDISVRTVEMHRAAMMERLGVQTFAEALRLAIEGGIAVPPLPTPVFARAASA